MRNVTPDCLLRLCSVYNTLRPKPALVADYIMEHPEEVISYNIGELAQMTGVSQFSVLNCIKAAGFNGYSDFKIALARDLGREDTLLFGDLERGDSAYSILCKVMRQRSRSLMDTLHLIDASTFDAAIAMVHSAQKIVLLACGNSCLAAEYLSFQLERLGISTIFQRDHIYQAMSARLVTEQDLVIAFSTAEANDDTLNLIAVAKENDCRTIVISTSASTEIYANADCVLLTSYSDPEIIRDANNAVSEQMALSAAITMCVANQDHDKALIQINRSISKDKAPGEKSP